MFVELAKTNGISIVFEMSAEIGIDAMCQLIDTTTEDVQRMLAKIRDPKKREAQLRLFCSSILNALADEELDEGLLTRKTINSYHTA
jgi:hypothetical protein